jgi:hypothetical protein
MANEKIYFYYDPIRQGYDLALWKTLAGVPAVAGNAIRLDTATIIGYADIFKGDAIFNLIVPVAPVAGQDKRFGFSQEALGAFVGFDITDDVFSLVAIDGYGNTKTELFEWQAAWTGVPVDFKVSWNGFDAVFFVNGVKVGIINDVAVPKTPLSIYIKNGNADNLDLNHLQCVMINNYL